MDIELIEELFKLVSALDTDWNGNERTKKNLVDFLVKKQDYFADTYVEDAYRCVAEYDETNLHLLRHKLINEILVETNKEHRQYFVYKHTVPNDKVYIGITCCQEPELRWYYGFGYKQNALFYADIEKFGWDNIKHEILYKGLSPQEARDKEIELIELYRATNSQYGYNLDIGGKIPVTPYIWSTWEYDIRYQFMAKRRPFKVVVDTKDLQKFKGYISKYDGEIIQSVQFGEFADQFFVVATNPSFKEKNIRETIDSFILQNSSSLQVQYSYGAVEGNPFEYDTQAHKLTVNLYLVDKRDYKFDKVIQDLTDILKAFTK